MLSQTARATKRTLDVIIFCYVPVLPSAPPLSMQPSAYFHSPASVYLRRVNKRQRVIVSGATATDAESHGTWWDVILPFYYRDAFTIPASINRRPCIASSNLAGNAGNAPNFHMLDALSVGFPRGIIQQLVIIENSFGCTVHSQSGIVPL